MLEFLEFAIDADPDQRFTRQAVAAGTIARSTGDVVTDKWDHDIAAGKLPDFTTGMDEESRAQLAKLLGQKLPADVTDAPPSIEDEFTDTYGDADGG